MEALIHLLIHWKVSVQRHCQCQWNLGIKYLNSMPARVQNCSVHTSDCCRVAKSSKDVGDIGESVTSFEDSSWATWTRLWEQIGAGRELGDLLQLHPTPSLIHITMLSWSTITPSLIIPSSETKFSRCGAFASVELQQWFPGLVGGSGVALAYDWAAKLRVFQQFQWSLDQAHCLQSSSDELSRIHPIYTWSLGCYGWSDNAWWNCMGMISQLITMYDFFHGRWYLLLHYTLFWATVPYCIYIVWLWLHWEKLWLSL